MRACVSMYLSSRLCPSLCYALRYFSTRSHTITICWSLFSRFFSFFAPFTTFHGGGGRILICSVAFDFEVLIQNSHMCMCIGHFESAILKFLAVQWIWNGKKLERKVKVFAQIQTHAHAYTPNKSVYKQAILTSDHSCACIHSEMPRNVKISGKKFSKHKCKMKRRREGKKTDICGVYA